MTNAEGNRLLAPYEDTTALYDPARRKAAYTGIATALNGYIEQRRAMGQEFQSWSAWQQPENQTEWHEIPSGLNGYGADIPQHESTAEQPTEPATVADMLLARYEKDRCAKLGEVRTDIPITEPAEPGASGTNPQEITPPTAQSDLLQQLIDDVDRR